MSILMSAVILLSGAELGGYGSSKVIAAGGVPDCGWSSTFESALLDCVLTSNKE